MPAKNTADKVLDFLWSGYRNDPSAGYDITAVCKESGDDPLVVSNGLRLEGLIRDDVAADNNRVLCSISMKGISRLDARFVEEKIDQVLSGMGEVNSISNVFNILRADPKDFQFAFDLANEMQNRDLVKLLYAFQPGKVVNVEMTLEGVRRKRTGNREQRTENSEQGIESTE